MKIEQLKEVTEVNAEEINNLLRQLAHDQASFTPVTFAALQSIVKDKNLVVMVAREGDKIVGTATLITAVTMSGFNAMIDDVVVDEKYRGQGLGEKLVQALIDRARELQVRLIELSSRPSRVAANKLYQKLGFKPKETNVYRLKL